MTSKNSKIRKVIFSKKVMKKAFLTSLVIGTILTFINQGDLILSNTFNIDFSWKIPLTYLIPYLVTTWGALTNIEDEIFEP